MSRMPTLTDQQESILTPWDLNLIIGDHINVTELTGTGGMGAVYLAWHSHLKREVAVKLLPKSLVAKNPQLADFFREEARAMARMDHPNIVKVFDIEETFRGDLYIVMEYVHGFNLAELIGGGGLTERHAQSWIPQIGMALQYAHNQGILHCDIKPANVLITREGIAKVTDFGLVKRMKPGGISGADCLGTAPYAAPELPGEPTPQSDIYSLGAVLFELLTGKMPTLPVPPLSEVRPTVDSRFENILNRALHRRTTRRYASAEQMADDVLRTTSKSATQPDMGSFAAPEPEPRRSRIPVKRAPSRNKRKYPWAWAWTQWTKLF
ncbi:MAG: serine/threonine-protein kinase [Verrucomicrobiota bacterium]